MNEKPESFQVAKQLTLRAIEELTEENVRLRLKNGRLREVLKLALENGCQTVHLNEDDEVGRRGCCDEVSYLPHSHDCWTVKARAAIDAAMKGDKT